MAAVQRSFVHPLRSASFAAPSGLLTDLSPPVAFGVGQPANAAAWLIVTCTFVPLSRVSLCKSPGARPPLPECASGVGQPVNHTALPNSAFTGTVPSEAPSL
jgi:hypothetical protein